MKKTLLATVLLAVSCCMMAASSKIVMTLTSPAGASDKLTLFEGDNFSADFDQDYDATKNMNDGLTFNVNLYVQAAWGAASKVAEANLEGTKVKFQANSIDADTYTITFSTVTAENYFLKDSKVQDAAGNDSLTAIVAGGTYSFTQAISTTEERFEIVKKPAEPAICHQYGNLIITGHKGAKVKVLDMADQVAIAEQTLATDDEVISLSSLEKGAMYQVVVDEETMIIRIQ